jgi:hypothetical protein
MLTRILSVWIAITAFCINAQAESLSTFRSKKIAIISDTTFLDSNAVDVASVRLSPNPGNVYGVIWNPSRIVWKSELPYPTDSVIVSYRLLAFDFSKVYQNKDRSLINEEYKKNPFEYVPKNDRFIETESSQIRTLGNVSRGIGFGNRQDVTVNSNLNLRLSGKIQDEIDILAAISDENNPIQPEGNTQQVQDFDRVFIQLGKDSTRLIAGDFPMVTPTGSYFMKYNKRSRGLQFQHEIKGSKGVWKMAGEGAISRGRFSRNTIAGIEGNQGPYRLTGANGETFIIIISGTERVYLDGQLLTRGEQNDYVVNYNTGELTFTPRKLITQYSRIVIEFQYSDRNYGRSVLRAGGSYTTSKYRIRANAFSEQDNKNQPFQQNLDDSVAGVSVRKFLRDAGDANLVYAPREELVLEYDPSEIVYVKKDSLGYTIFQQATPDDTGDIYRVSFSYVGSGNGDYIQKLSTSNGKVFEWTEPNGNESVGDYAPVEVLVPPKRQRMFNVGFDYFFSPNTEASIEFVSTQNDLNTFSSLDEEDDQGYGLRFDVRSTKALTKDSIGPWKIGTHASYELTQQDFRYIERYRNVEFYRQWNRTLENPTEQEEFFDEQIAQLGLTLSKGKRFQLKLAESYYQQGTKNSGLAQSYTTVLNQSNYSLRGGVENIRSNIPVAGVDQTNRFERYFGAIDQRNSWIRSSFQYEQEKSAFSRESDSIFDNSYSFNQMQLRLSSGDSNALRYGLTVKRRVDDKGQFGEFASSTDGRDAQLELNWTQSRNAQFNFTSTYRQLIILDTAIKQDQPENTLQGRLETRINLWRKFVTTTAYYQLGTGQEQQRQYTYFEVGDGNGNYVWNDYDSNGVQSLNEFELASSFDAGRANFIRQFLPVQGFIKSFSSEYNQNVRIRPVNVLRKTQKDYLKFLRRFSNVTSVKVIKKVTDNNETFFNPFVQNVEDTALLTTNSILRTILSFNQTSPKFGMDWQHFETRNKILLINGVDARFNSENKIKVRYNINKNYEFVTEAIAGNKVYTSQFLTDRAFDYTYQSIKPTLGYQFRTRFRIEAYYQYFEAHNRPEFGNETTYNHDFTTELRWNFLNKGTIRTNVGLVNINYNGNDNSPVAYELLLGLRNGRNLKWNLQIERRFANSIQVVINYDGRQSIDNPIIHIGRLHARYLF